MFPIVNYKGDLISKSSQVFSFEHFAISKGEILQESLRLYNNEFLFKEEHYFHLMAQMRMARIDIPMHFTPTFFYNELAKLKNELNTENASFNFYVSANRYEPDFWITAKPLIHSLIFESNFEVEQFRDTHVANGLHKRISFLEPKNRILKTYANENDYQDLILLNEQKSIAHSIKGNIFVIKDNSLFTPDLQQGALDNVFRDKLITACKRAPHFDEVKVEAVFPFSLMKADEVFILVNGEGVYPITKFRKKEYKTEFLPELINFFLELNS